MKALLISSRAETKRLVFIKKVLGSFLRIKRPRRILNEELWRQIDQWSMDEIRWKKMNVGIDWPHTEAWPE